MMRESAAAQGLTRRGVVQLSIEKQIPASIEALNTHAHAPRGLIAPRVAAKSEGA
jgi:hypothetical protein